MPYEYPDPEEVLGSGYPQTDQSDIAMEDDQPTSSGNEVDMHGNLLSVLKKQTKVQPGGSR